MALATDYTRHNDALWSLCLNSPNPDPDAVVDQINSARALARAVVAAIDTLDDRRLFYGAVVGAAGARLKQLDYLATDATDHLSHAVDILYDVRARPGASDDKALLWEAGRRITLAQELTALGAQDCTATAELLVTELRRQDALVQPLAVSPTQQAALRAIAQGYVTIDRLDGKPLVSRDDIRITISTIRSLEARTLVVREGCPQHMLERVRLTTDGCRALADTFGRPTSSTPATTRAVQPTPTTAPGRTQTTTPIPPPAPTHQRHTR
ncbi:hypothetical protein [Streptomyces silvisoli]|uniref:DUF222 domain-containing protein n=1 Tax=Streptomyces silvisoli TaxID=3034235 RepID=A0ABT5ZRD3_9ACTN|nr:hypothetical protein [Streptomyces silvisoli]MDF3292392.1 hypothetical protein [Streptomyces silvisoli]